MKTLKIGEKDYRIMETADDISPDRFVELRNVMLMNDASGGVGGEVDTLSKIIAMVNTGNIPVVDLYEIVRSRVLFLKGLEQNPFDDHALRIFGIITLEDGEEPHRYSKSLADEKLKRMTEQGLSMGTVWREVTPFLIGLPEISVPYFLKTLAQHGEQLTSSKKLHEQTSDSLPSNILYPEDPDS